MRQVVILAGGKGTRLKERLGDLPKPMVNLAGKPLLEHQVILAKSCGFENIVMLVGYRADAIREYFGNGDNWGVSIQYVEEPVPRGTAGAVVDAMDVLAERFIVMYGDTMPNVDLDRFYKTHENHQADATLFLHPNDHPHDSDLVDIDSGGHVKAFYPYPHDPDRYYANLVNAALYVIDRAVLLPYTGSTGIVDFGKQLFPAMLEDGKTLYGYVSPEYIKDAGTPKRLDRVEADIYSGVVAKSTLAEMAPAVFLDRDGTLNVEKDRISTADDMELLDNVTTPLRRLDRSIYRTAVITNQPVIARGDCSETELKQIHNKLETLLGREGAYVDAIYYCPHHPHKGYAGERSELKIVCSCRKPSPGLIYRAANDMNIDLQSSWMIGDSTMDIMAARNAGVRSILVRTGHGGKDNKFPVRPDFEFYNLEAAVGFILDDFPALYARAREMVKDIHRSETIVVAGLAHTGKSTWSTLLRYAIEEQGYRCAIVSLDNWLKSAEHRGSGGVLDRYDIAEIEELVDNLDGTHGTLEYRMPHYDRYQRKQLKTGDTLMINDGDIIIYDGVIGLLVDALKDRSSRRIFIEGSEGQRRTNFWSEYRTRGASDAEIETLFQKREIDEIPVVLSSKSSANLII